MSEEADGAGGEDALGRVDSEAMHLEALEEYPQVLLVLLLGFGRHQDVIDVHVGKFQVTGDLVDKPLKSLSSVAQTKWHSKEFEKAKWCDDGSLCHVIFSHWDLVEGFDQVQFAEHRALFPG